MRARALGIALVALSIVVVVGPFLWVLANSFKSPIAILQGAWTFVPTLDNYADVLSSKRSDFVHALATSLAVATASTVIVVAIATLAAYSLHRFAWAQWVVRGLLVWTLAFHVIPIITMVGPWYVAFRHLGLYDTRTALVLTHVVINLPVALWLMMSFFRAVPPEIEEAAMVDGCHALASFRYVVLPLVVPGLIATGVLSFIFSWNEFPVALTLTQRDTATVPVAIGKFAQENAVNYSQMASAALLATIPAVILLLVAQRSIVRGLTTGAIK